ncbi:MAG: 4Fe-4S binding protein [Euryarchaeota archaeon]|nr:4Fe-4S binding protein [Euryarchaeota archaeon]MBU4547663.1 4Fe-4S binding protein [Euryarchaeota archaeon]MBU4608399.1 4Fe-4S binding protein [Euryarchaeota archaeon]MBV1728802.1 4Fe-4S binding protein [Methanobacterium sp.]MBV1755463.1 4Fe-4S binding protein [Methanobacterium sp.]
MFLSTKKCEGSGECIKECPTQAIRLVEGKAFSCITCGACAEACPNRAIFKNKYGGYVLDRAKCNACGVCEFTCPVNSINIEDGLVKGICARCGICKEACPLDARIDAFDIIEDRQLQFLESLNIAIPSTPKLSPKSNQVQRVNVVTDLDKCTLCRRCEYYCPTEAIMVNVNQKGVCTQCRVCEDICPADAIKDTIIDPEKCTLCLKCVKECPNNAIYVDDFQVKIKHLRDEEALSGTIISCLNCGLCVEACQKGALKLVDGKIRCDPNVCEDCETMECQEICPVGTLKPSNEFGPGIKGYCVSCGRCVKACDINEARSFKNVTWDGSVSSDCISCGICAEICPKDAITLKRGTIEVDPDRCILCEKCGIHCPVDAIPRTTMRKKSIKDGFTLIDDKLCMKCNLCAKICPEEAISQDADGRMIVDESKCIYCGACSNACPARAVIFDREFELSS